jgi:type I restriction-modification system DNA methylase subunit
MPANTTEIEKRLWDAADELRANSKLKSSEYSIPVLGLIFLRYADIKFARAEEELVGAQSSAPTAILREMEIILPPIELQNKFTEFISEIDALLQNIDKKNANLRRTRDLLLPRLVSRGVSVEGIEE